MKALLVLFVIVVGMTLPVQAGVNAKLRTYVGDPMLAGVWNFTLGLLLLLTIVMATRVPVPTTAALAKAPWWAWTGGALGATLVVTSLFAAPRLGASLLIAALLTGQLLSSTLIDHYGWVGYPSKPISPMRIAGLVLLVAGVLLVERSTVIGTPDSAMAGASHESRAGQE